MEVEPDKRAGTVSKTDRSTPWNGEHALRLPPFGSQALQRCSGLLIRRARGSTVVIHMTLGAPIQEVAIINPCVRRAGKKVRSRPPRKPVDRVPKTIGKPALLFSLHIEFLPAWMDKKSRRFCKAEDAGALPAAGSIYCPVR